MNYKRILFVALVAILAICKLIAQENNNSYQFLNVTPSAQSLSMGGMVVTFVDSNPSLAFDNPALFGQESAGQLYLSYSNFLKGVNGANAMFGWGFGERGTWSIGARSLIYQNMERRDANGNYLGNFNAMDIALQGGVAYDFTEYLRGGLSLKAIYANIDRYSNVALATDAGISYFNDDIGTSLAMVVTNVGASVYSSSQRRSLPPWDIRLGWSQALTHAPFRVHLTAYGLSPRLIRSFIPDEKVIRQVLSHFSGGLEFRPNEQFWIGLGYNPKIAFEATKQGGRSISGLSLGTGFNNKYLRVSIGAAQYRPHVLTLMFSISTNFGSNKYLF